MAFEALGNKERTYAIFKVMIDLTRNHTVGFVLAVASTSENCECSKRC